MKRLLVLIFFIILALASKAQFVTQLQNPGDLSYKYIGFNSMKPLYSSRDSLDASIYFTGDSWFKIWTNSVIITRIDSSHNDGKPKRIILATDSGSLGVCSVDSIPVSWNQVIGVPSFLTSEVDPYWHGDSSNYYKKGAVNLLVAPKMNYSDTLGLSNRINQKGTVNSVAFSSGDLSVSGSPITNSGTITANLITTGVTPGTYNSVTVDNKGRVTSASNIGTGTVTSIGLTSSDLSVSGSPVTTSGNITANLSTTGVSAGSYNTVTVDTKGRVTAGYNPTNNPAVTRPINGTTYTISTTQAARVYYTIRISCTASIGSNSSGLVLLQYSTNGGSTWIDLPEVQNSNTVTLAIALNSVTVQTGVIAAEIPANALCRMTTTQSGTTTVTYVRGQEVLY